MSDKTTPEFYLKAAENNLSIKYGFYAFFSGEDSYEEASKNYARASNLFKLQKQYQEAGDTQRQGDNEDAEEGFAPFHAVHVQGE